MLRTPLARDLGVAAALTLVAQAELVLGAEETAGPRWLQHLAFAVMTAAVALRRTAPLAAVLVFAAGMAAQALAGPAPVAGGFLAMLVVLASLGYHRSLRAGVIGLVAVGAAGVVYDLREGFVAGDLLANAVIVVGAWAAGWLLRRAVDRRVEAEVAAERAAQEAAAAERTRIARDLHDSVAHALTLMTLQAGGARERADQPAVVESLRLVEQTGRTALADMHRFLRLLGDQATEAPGLADLPDLVERVRAGGVEVALALDCDPAVVPASISATAYRVVQESLTNALKHAPGSAVTVRVSGDSLGLTVEVDDDGRGAAAEGAGAGVATGGLGLRSLRSRVALFRGSLEAGRTRESGWRVRVRIPWEHGLAP